MARDEAKVRVTLDTSRAKAELRGLNRTAANAARRVGGGIRRTVGAGLGAVGLGGGIGIGLGAVRQASSSSFGDVIGEAFSQIGAQLSERLFGNLNEEARSSKMAREDVINAYGRIAGRMESVPSGALNMFKTMQEIHRQQLRGREVFELHDDFNPIKLEDVISRVMKGIGELLAEAVDALAAKLNPFSGK